MHYIITGKRDQEITETVPVGEIVARINELTGRCIGSYIVTTAIPSSRRRHGRASAYVAANRTDANGQPTLAHAIFGGGFSVEMICS